MSLIGPKMKIVEKKIKCFTLHILLIESEDKVNSFKNYCGLKSIPLP